MSANEPMGARPVRHRIAGAPISWGVCEVPGWGYQLPPEVVLPEMRALGLFATEFGPEGFLPDAPAEKARLLRANDLAAVGAFVPLVLHESARDPILEAEHALEGLVTAEAGTMVVAAATGGEGYDARPELDQQQWRTMLSNLNRIADTAWRHGIRVTLHPHIGTMVENRGEVERVLAGSTVPLCLDTGHLLVAGVDPVELTAEVPERIAHAHLKDVDHALAEQVRSGKCAYTEAVRAGMFRPLGAGDVEISDIVGRLERHGYSGWYVLEQDIILAEEPVDGGPSADVARSLEFLRELAG